MEGVMSSGAEGPSKELYSPGQVLGGALFGGFLAGGWLLAANLRELGRNGRAWSWLAGSALALATYLWLFLSVYDGRPPLWLGLAVPVAAALVYGIATKRESTKAPSDVSERSTWGVFWAVVVFGVLAVLLFDQGAALLGFSGF